MLYFAIAIAALCVSPAQEESAQEKPNTKEHRQPKGESQGFGCSVLEVGDVDGDGTRDIAAGRPYERKVYVFSGADQKVLQTWKSTYNKLGFGSSLRDVGDVNGDGYPEVLVGFEDFVFNGNPNYSEVRSSLDGSLLYSMDKRASEFVLLGDVDRDGVGDFGWMKDKELRLVSGKGGKESRPLATLGLRRQLFFGADRNGDGLAEGLWVGASTALLYSKNPAQTQLVREGERGPGFVSLFPKARRSEVDRVEGAAWPWFRAKFALVEDAGDLDGDGLEDLWVQSLKPRSGLMHAVSWKSPGEPIFTFHTPSYPNGDLLVLAGRDLNKDGTPDVLICEQTAIISKQFKAHSGKDGKLLWKSHVNDRGGAARMSWDWLEDVTGDGVSDFVISIFDSELHGPLWEGILVALDGASGEELWRVDEMDF